MYKLIITQKALMGMQQISAYIAHFFGRNVASKKIHELQNSINSLKENPHKGHPPSDINLAKRGFLVLTMDKDVALYKVNESDKTVTLYVIADQRQDYIRFLK